MPLEGRQDVKAAKAGPARQAARKSNAALRKSKGLSVNRAGVKNKAAKARKQAGGGSSQTDNKARPRQSPGGRPGIGMSNRMGQRGPGGNMGGARQGLAGRMQGGGGMQQAGPPPMPQPPQLPPQQMQVQPAQAMLGAGGMMQQPQPWEAPGSVGPFGGLPMQKPGGEMISGMQPPPQINQAFPGGGGLPGGFPGGGNPAMGGKGGGMPAGLGGQMQPMPPQAPQLPQIGQPMQQPGQISPY